MKHETRKGIERAIRAKGWSQAHVARQLLVEPAVFNNWLNRDERDVPEEYVAPLATVLDLSPDAINPDAADRWRKALRLHPPVEPKVITDIGPISQRALAIARTFDALTPARQQIVDLLFHEWFAGDPPVETKKPRKIEQKAHAQR